MATLLAILRLAVFEPVRVPTSSMAPTLRPGDHLLTQTIGLHRRGPSRRELITFRHPKTGALTIKRVSAVGGDVVEIRDGVLYVNGRPVREDYVDHRTVDSVYYGPERVPPRSVFVLGDQRANSEDSRTFGPVPVSGLVGRVVLRLWPPNRAGAVS